MHFTKGSQRHVANDELADGVEAYLTCVRDSTRAPPDCTVPPTILALVKDNKKLATRTMCLAIREISRPRLRSAMLHDLMTDHIFAQLPLWAVIQEAFHALRADKDSPWVTQLDVLNLLRALMPAMLDLVDPPLLDIVADGRNPGEQPHQT